MQSDTYNVGNDVSLMHDVVDILYDVANSFPRFIDDSGLLQCHTQPRQLLQVTRTTTVTYDVVTCEMKLF